MLRLTDRKTFQGRKSVCVLKYFIMFMFVLVPQIYIHHLENGLNQVRKCAMMEERGGGTDKARVRREGGE